MSPLHEFLPETCQHCTAKLTMIHRFHDWLLYGKKHPKHLKEPKHSTTVKNQNTSQQYCTVLLLVFVLLLVLLDVYSQIGDMSSVDTWPKAVQNWLKAAHIT